jgi:hypothetical protein
VRDYQVIVRPIESAGRAENRAACRRPVRQRPGVARNKIIRPDAAALVERPPAHQPARERVGAIQNEAGQVLRWHG